MKAMTFTLSDSGRTVLVRISKVFCVKALNDAHTEIWVEGIPDSISVECPYDDTVDALFDESH